MVLMSCFIIFILYLKTFKKNLHRRDVSPLLNQASTEGTQKWITLAVKRLK